LTAFKVQTGNGLLRLAAGEEKRVVVAAATINLDNLQESGHKVKRSKCKGKEIDHVFLD